jgi:hypothetical protein
MHQRIDVFHARKIPVVRAPRNFNDGLEAARSLYYFAILRMIFMADDAINIAGNHPDI